MPTAKTDQTADTQTDLSLNLGAQVILLLCRALALSNTQIQVFYTEMRIHRNSIQASLNEPPHDKTNKMSVCPAKTRISLGIRPV